MREIFRRNSALKGREREEAGRRVREKENNDIKEHMIIIHGIN